MGQHAPQKVDEKKTACSPKAKRSGQTRDWERYKRLKAEVQRSTRRAHRGYMEDFVSKDLKENSKRVCSFIKSKQQEASGVSALLNNDGYHRVIHLS